MLNTSLVLSFYAKFGVHAFNEENVNLEEKHISLSKGHFYMFICPITPLRQVKTRDKRRLSPSSKSLCMSPAAENPQEEAMAKAAT